MAYPTLLLYLQVLHLGDPALDHPQDEQTRPEDPEGARGGQSPVGQAAEQEGLEGSHVGGLCWWLSWLGLGLVELQ